MLADRYADLTILQEIRDKMHISIVEFHSCNYIHTHIYLYSCLQTYGNIQYTNLGI